MHFVLKVHAFINLHEICQDGPFSRCPVRAVADLGISPKLGWKGARCKHVSAMAARGPWRSEIRVANHGQNVCATIEPDD